MMRQVRTDVIAATGERQVPWDHSSLTDAVVLVPAVGGQPAALPASPAPAPATAPMAARPLAPSAAPQPSTADAERAWAVTKDTTSIAVLQDFVRQFGKTPYGSMARARLKELQAAAAPKPPDKVAVATPGAAPSAPAPVAISLTGRWRVEVSGPAMEAVLSQSPDGSITGTIKGGLVTKEFVGTISGTHVSFMIKYFTGDSQGTLVLDPSARPLRMEGASSGLPGKMSVAITEGRMVMTKLD
jgi:hypothetical protein